MNIQEAAEDNQQLPPALPEEQKEEDPHGNEIYEEDKKQEPKELKASDQNLMEEEKESLGEPDKESDDS